MFCPRELNGAGTGLTESEYLGPLLAQTGASPRIFEWGGSNRRQGDQPTPKYPKNQKTPDFGHFNLESGGSNHTVFKSAGVRTLPPDPPPSPSATPLGTNEWFIILSHSHTETHVHDGVRPKPDKKAQTFIRRKSRRFRPVTRTSCAVHSTLITGRRSLIHTTQLETGRPTQRAEWRLFPRAGWPRH